MFPFATLETRGKWAELFFAKTSGTLTRDWETLKRRSDRQYAGDISAPVPLSFPKRRNDLFNIYPK